MTKDSGDANDVNKDFPPNRLHTFDLLSIISSGSLSGIFKYKPEDKLEELHKRSSVSIFLRGLRIEYRFDMEN